MTQEKKKELLFKDLCARLPYGVKVCCITLSDEMPKVWTLIGLPAPLLADIIVDGKYRFAACEIENIRSYLRPMSSMTEKEKEEYNSFSLEDWISNPFYFVPAFNVIDWLNQHHLDYRNLIATGLALEAPEGMYNNNTNN